MRGRLGQSRAPGDGGPRARARNQATVQGYLRAVRPALLAWSAIYDHLRAVGHADVHAHAETLCGHQRQTTIVGLRSLFVWAKTNGVVFRDPTRRIRVGRRDWPVWQPLLPEEIARTVDAVTTPQARLVVTLAAVHAARRGAIRSPAAGRRRPCQPPAGHRRATPTAGRAYLSGLG